MKTKMSVKYSYAVVIAVFFVASFAAAFSSKYHKNVQTQASVSFRAENNAQRIAFLNSYNIKTEEEPFSICDVIIPSSFDAIYQKFEAVQNAQGLSLKEYKGQKLQRYSYLLSKGENGNSNTVAELFVYEKNIVACALYDLKNTKGFDIIIK